MSEVIEFAKILRRHLEGNSHVSIYVGRAIEEFESTRQHEPGCDADCEGLLDVEVMDRPIEDGGSLYAEHTCPCKCHQESRGREHADAGSRLMACTPDVAGSHPAPSTPPPGFQRRQCNTCGRYFWNTTGICPCTVNTFDREAAARRARKAVCKNSYFVLPWDEIGESGKEVYRRVVDAVLDVPSAEQGSASKNEARTDWTMPPGVTPGEFGTAGGSHPAPSPSLDELREAHINARNARQRLRTALTSEQVDDGFSLAVAREAIAVERRMGALTKALAASQAEVAQLRDKAIRFDLDVAGIERREAEAVELVDLRAEVERLRNDVSRANRVAADAAIRSGGNLQRAEAAEREVARLRDIIDPGDAAAYEECAANMQARLVAAEAQLAKLREPLTNEECATNLAGYARSVYLRAGCECEAEPEYAWPSPEGLATWTGVVRAVIAKFFELREVKP